MAEVTSIRRGRSGASGQTVRIELDGEPWLEAAESLVAEFRIYRGLELDDERRADIERRAAELGALAYCHATIARRPHTEAELRRKLAGRELSPAIIDQAIVRCHELGLLDDAAYALGFAGGRSRRGHGARRIRQDLQQRGVAREAIDAALAELDGATDPVAQCSELLERRFSGVDLGDPRQRGRAERFLARRGFGWTEIGAALATRRE